MRWDHVVVGAGSAGAVVAERLSADGSRSVLVLEAGPDPVAAGWDGVVGGADFFAAAGRPELTWPELAAVPAEGVAPQPYLQGRVLGGTGAVNAMVAQRPLAADLDRWEQHHGGRGWGAQALRPLVEGVAATGHAVPANERGPLARAWIEAAVSGVGPTADPPAAGVAPAALTWRTGRRWSSGEQLGAAAPGRANLTVRTGALVDRVLFDGDRVAGVRLVDGEEVEAASVVVAAGALHTPGVLVRSGIGHPGIGANLRDHPALQVTLPLAVPVPGGWPVVAVVERWSSEGDALDLIVTPLEHVGDRAAGGVTVALVAPRSVGSLRVPSLVATEEPVVELGHLGHEHDVERLVAAAARLARRLLHPALQALAGGPVVVDGAGTPAEALLDTDAARAWLPSALGGSYHAAGTCRMGPPGDPMAVVDAHGAVVGVDGLWLADASILPELPRANPHLTCVVIGLRVAGHVAAATRER